ncbi:MAG: TatD family hydrolase [Clostridia bacterium]|nr:TatD family hydrolase [Clostridia bacterium]
MLIFDTHAHYESEQFEEDRDELLKILPQNNVSYVINQGTDIATSKKSIELAEQYDYFFAAVGIHPEEVKKQEAVSEIEKLASHPKVVAIGEIGLDYYWDVSTKELQMDYFKKQLDLANQLHLPVVIHDRDAHKDVLDTLKSTTMNSSGVVHCFSGSVEMAKEILKKDFYLGFDGPITFKNARVALEVLEYTPLDRILIETDAPYLTPEPFRGKRNNSMYLTYVINKIAEIKKVSPEEIAEITFQNAKTLFGI